MPIPETRAELVDQTSIAFAKLQGELEAGGPRLGSQPCIDDWTVKDLLAVRAWWSEAVVAWIELGRRGGTPVTPAEGYRWRETPRLNRDLVQAARRQSYRGVRARLLTGYDQVVATIDALDDVELLTVGHFAWAGRYPIRRWISLNTTRQYTTARTYVRRARLARES